MNARLSLACRAVLALSCLCFTPAVRAEDPRVMIHLEGADPLIADLRHLCVDLADKPRDWDNNVLPNLEIYFIGADRTRPVRYDHLIGTELGRRVQLMAPIQNLNNFINNKLVPIGINVWRNPNDKDLYQLVGAYNGWMRIKDRYAIIADADHLADLPPDMPTPTASHIDLWNEGYDFAARLDNSLTLPHQRIEAFAKYRDDTLAGIQQRADETDAQFALRRLNKQQSLEKLERVFVESSQITAGLTIDSRWDEGHAKLTLEAEPETPLADTLSRQAQQPSRFAGVVDPDNSILSGRVNYALGRMSMRHLVHRFDLMKTPLAERIDNTDGLTDAHKSARKEITALILNLLTSSVGLDWCEAMIEITPHFNGKHTALLGCCAKETAAVATILKRLPDALRGCRTELDVDSAGEVAIHKLTISEGYPQALADFFGSTGELLEVTGEVYVGAGPDSIWLSIGEDALAELKAGIEAAEQTPAADPDLTVARLDLNLLPVLRLMNRLRDDGDFDVRETLTKTLALIEPPPQSDEPDEDNPDEIDSFDRILDDFEWRKIAIEELDPDADRLHIDVQRVEDRLEAKASVESGILKAIGALIAQFARDYLG